MLLNWFLVLVTFAPRQLTGISGQSSGFLVVVAGVVVSGVVSCVTIVVGAVVRAVVVAPPVVVRPVFGRFVRAVVVSLQSVWL